MHRLVVATYRRRDVRRVLPSRYLIERQEPLSGPRMDRLLSKQTEILRPVAPLRTVDLQHPSLMPGHHALGHLVISAPRHRP